jgi:hypothetical protein
LLRTFASTAFAALAFLTPPAQTGVTIRVWTVGSPHTGETPDTKVPPALAREAAGRGWRMNVEAFPAQGFADRFFAAARDRSAPDVVVLENLGMMNGITVGADTFTGIGQDSAIRSKLVQVTGSFDELLGPARGWTFLFTSSVNHAAARELALRSPRCASTSSTAGLPVDLAGVIPEVATAYLTNDDAGILSHADPERLATARQKTEHVTVGGVAICGGWGNERLAFVSVNTSYQAEAIGHAALVLAFRRTSSRWQLLVAARDPVSNRDFARRLPALDKLLAADIAAGPVPDAATLISPEDGLFPVPENGQRFGDFRWLSSSAEAVVAEVAEFSYKGDTRLILLPAPGRGAPRQVSAGSLWTTGGEWTWRVWSITRSGEVAFSPVRTFVH